METVETVTSKPSTSSIDSYVIDMSFLDDDSNTSPIPNVTDSMLKKSEGYTYESPELAGTSNVSVIRKAYKNPQPRSKSAPTSPTITEKEVVPKSKNDEWEVDPLSLNRLVELIVQQQNTFASKITELQNTVHALNDTQKTFETKLSEIQSNVLKRMDRKLDSLDESWQTSFTEIEDDFTAKYRDLKAENATIKKLWEDHMDLIKQNLMRDHRPNETTESESRTSSSSTPFDTRSQPDNTSSEIENLKKKIHELDCRIIDCEQYSRRDCFIISGIPKSIKDGVDLEETVLDIIYEIGLNLASDDIVACHRLPNNHGSRSRVIVKFMNRKVAEFCLAHKDRLNLVRENLGYNLRIYESLCKSNGESFRTCLWLKSEEVIHDFFVRNGSVFIVENEGGKPYKISHPESLRNMFPEIDD